MSAVLRRSRGAGAWHRAAVALITDDGVLQSCGMHAFSLPDARVPLDEDQASLSAFIGALNVYQLAEDPVLRSGETFAPDAQTPRRVLERWPDTLYPSRHATHNPYGVFRLGPSGGSRRGQSELTYVFMPSLHAVLLALESKKGRPLTREDVEAARDGAACVAMKPRDAQRLERSRGYADLDPELAWDQWQAARLAGAG